MSETLLPQNELPHVAAHQTLPGTANLEHGFYNILMQAPAAIVVFSGPQYVIEFANDLYLHIAGKSRQELLHKPAFDTMPVASSQGFKELLDNIRLSGLPLQLTEHKTLIERKGRIETSWLNIVYQPIKEASGVVERIMILMTDVTESVLTRLQKEAEESLLRKTKDQLELSISIGHIGVWHWDVRNNVLTWSKEQLDLYGLRAEEFGGRIEDFHCFVLPEDIGLLKGTAQFERSTNGDYEYQFRVRRTDGEIRLIQGRSRSFYNTEGEVEYRTGVNIDITDRSKAEQALRQSEEKFRSTFDNAAVGIAHVAIEGSWLLVNNRLCAIVGYTKEELLSSTFQNITHPDDLELDWQLLQEVLAGRRSNYTLEKRYIHKSGNVVWINLTVSLVRHNDGSPNYFISIVEDINERKKAEEKIIESEERLSLTVEAASLGLWDYDIRSNVAAVSGRTREFYNLQKDEPFTFERFLSVVHPDDRAWMADRNRQVLFETNSPLGYTAEFRVIRKDGVVRWMRSTGRVILNEKGERYRFSGAIMDITEEKLAAQALQQSESRFRTLAEALPQMVWMTDGSGKQEYASHNWQAYSGAEDLDKSWNAMVHPDDWKTISKAREKNFPAGRAFQYEVRLKNKEGQYRWHYSVAEPIRDEEGRLLKWIGALTDIHEQKTFAEKLENEVAERTKELKEKNTELENTQSFLQQLIDSSVEFISVVDKDFRFITINSRLEKTLKVTRETVKGKHLFEVSPEVQSSFIHKCISIALAGETVYLDKRPALSRPGLFIDTYFIPLSLQGEVKGVIVMARDVTEIVKSERLLEEKNKELERSNEDLQQFAHVASHDLKEPIRKVSTFGSRLEEEYGNLLPERGKLYLRKMLSSAERMFGLIDGVLNYSTINSLENTFEQVDLNEIIHHIENDLEVVLLQSGGQFLVTKLPSVKGTRVLLNQLFYNLLNNALKFSKPGVAPQVSVQASYVLGKTIEDSAESEKEKPFVQIKICDNGIGFKPEYADRIFKTFTRLNSRDRYEGTGLGLALCKKIVERHHGYIYATGSEGEGACFYVLLPA